MAVHLSMGEVKRYQYKYIRGGVWSTDGAPGNNDNSPVKIGKGNWMCRVIIKREKVDGVWKHEDVHTDYFNVKKTMRVKVEKEGDKYKIVQI